jgi:hypothetical protein
MEMTFSYTVAKSGKPMREHEICRAPPDRLGNQESKLEILDLKNQLVGYPNPDG